MRNMGNGHRRHHSPMEEDAAAPAPAPAPVPRRRKTPATTPSPQAPSGQSIPQPSAPLQMPCLGRAEPSFSMGNSGRPPCLLASTYYRTRATPTTLACPCPAAELGGSKRGGGEGGGAEYVPEERNTVEFETDADNMDDGYRCSLGWEGRREVAGGLGLLCQAHEEQAAAASFLPPSGSKQLRRCR